MKKTINFNKMKYILLCLLFMPFGAFAQANLVATVDAVPPMANDETFNYNLQVISGSSSFDSVRIQLIYDPSVIDLLTTTIPLPTGFTVELDQNLSIPGTIRYEAGKLGGTPLSGTYDFFTLQFKLLDNSQIVNIDHLYTGLATKVLLAGDDVLGSANNISFNALLSTSSVFKSSIAVYPNPAKDNLYINLNKSTEAVKGISLYSIDGKLIKSINNVFNNRLIEVDTKGLNDALYFMTVISENDNKATYKVMVKK